MAEAVAKINASGIFEAFSAGTETRPEINQTAVGIIKSHYNVDMNKTQTSKLIDVLPPIDILITMGCNVDCPHLPNKHREDWGLDDPSGKSIEEFEYTLKLIEEKIEDLKYRITNNLIGN